MCCVCVIKCFTDEAEITGDYSDYMNNLPSETALLLSYTEKNGELSFDEKHKLYYTHKYREEQIENFWRDDLEEESEEYLLWHEAVKAAEWIDKKYNRQPISQSRIQRIERWFKKFKAEKDKYELACTRALAGTPFGTFGRAMIYSRCCMCAQRDMNAAFDVAETNIDSESQPWQAQRLEILTAEAQKAKSTFQLQSPIETRNRGTSVATNATTSTTGIHATAPSMHSAAPSITSSVSASVTTTTNMIAAPGPELYRLDEIRNTKYKDGIARVVYGLPHRQPYHMAEPKCFLKEDKIYKVPLVHEILFLESWPFGVSRFTLQQRQQKSVESVQFIQRMHGYLDWFEDNKYSTFFRPFIEDVLTGPALPADDTAETVERMSKQVIGALWYTYCKIVFEKMNDIKPWAEVGRPRLPLRPTDFMWPLVKNIAAAHRKTNYRWCHSIIKFLKSELQDYDATRCREYIDKLNNPDKKDDDDDDDDDDDYWQDFLGGYVLYVCIVYHMQT